VLFCHGYCAQLLNPLPPVRLVEQTWIFDAAHLEQLLRKQVRLQLSGGDAIYTSLMSSIGK